MIIRTTLLLALASSALLSGCASHGTPSFGESLMMRSEQQQALAAKWSEGSKLLKRGQGNTEDGKRMIERGQKLIEDGHKQLILGQEQLSQGAKLKQEAEAGYLQLRSAPIPLPGSVPAPAASAESAAPAAVPAAPAAP